MHRVFIISIVASFAFAVSACELYLGGHITSQHDSVVPDAGSSGDAGAQAQDGGHPWWPDAELAPDAGCVVVDHDAGSYLPDAALEPDGGWILPVDAH